jgi:hypothetical protein
MERQYLKSTYTPRYYNESTYVHQNTNRHLCKEVNKILYKLNRSLNYKL